MQRGKSKRPLLILSINSRRWSCMSVTEGGIQCVFLLVKQELKDAVDTAKRDSTTPRAMRFHLEDSRTKI